jgi:hypothetical protein
MLERMADRNKDLYDLLEVSPNASPGVIRAAYYVLARAWHPDVNSAPEAAQRIRDLNDAYEVLSDPQRRAGYDLNRARASRRERLLAPQVPTVVPPTRGGRQPVTATGVGVSRHVPRGPDGPERLTPVAAGRFPVYSGPTMLVLLATATVVAGLLILFSVGLGLGDESPGPMGKDPNIEFVAK